MVGREPEWSRLTDFASNGDASASLGTPGDAVGSESLPCSRTCVKQMRGFYYHALRGSSAEAHRDLAIGPPTPTPTPTPTRHTPTLTPTRRPMLPTLTLTLTRRPAV
jgi:hypothetical protein